eukprot:5484123-Ditylum_brightwellii.AAC.1
MCQAKLNNILVEDYAVSDPSEDEYDECKLKDTFLKNNLLITTIISNTHFFMNVKTMSDLQMYQKLLSMFQGQEYKKDKAVIIAGE